MTEPKWLTIARSYIGTSEIVGAKHSPKIIGWLKRLKSWIKDDETPWCGTFVAAVMQEVGLGYPDMFVRAKAWADYGANLRATHLAPGAILVFSREGGGHVGFYIGEDTTAYHVLGGNQKNQVRIDRILKSRCIARRWPRDVPVLGGPVHLSADGAVSGNEA